MKNLFIKVRLWNCQTNSVDDVVAFAGVLQQHQVTLLKHETLEPLSEGEWRKVFEVERAKEWHIFKWSIHHSLAMQDWGELNTSFRLDEYPEGTNKLEFGGLLDFEFKDERPLVEPFAQRLLAVARDLYPLARPTYGEVEGGWGAWESDDVRKRRLKHISWVNFFSPAYVEKYGKAFLLGLPGYKTEELPDGGVFHQLSPSIVATGEKEAKALRKEVVAYCARSQLKLSCHAPFVVHGLVAAKEGRAEDPIRDDGLKTYLEQILSTTLVLGDGTRVKPISIPWEVLSSRQEQMAVDAIKRTAVAEIKKHGRAHIRFEFNEIPAALDEMLTELAGRNNASFEWVQVDMP